MTGIGGAGLDRDNKEGSPPIPMLPLGNPLDVTSGSPSPIPSIGTSMSPSIASSLASSIVASKLNQHSSRNSLQELQLHMARAFEGAFHADMTKENGKFTYVPRRVATN